MLGQALTRKLRNAQCRWRFWHSWGLAAERRLPTPSRIVLLGIFVHLVQVMLGVNYRGLQLATGFLLSLTVALTGGPLLAASAGDDDTEPRRTHWTSPYSMCRLGPKSQGGSSRSKTCTAYPRLRGILFHTRKVSEVRVASHASGEVGVGFVHESSGKTFHDNQAPLQQLQWTAKRAFRRASVRAQRGPTWYKGTLHTATSLQAMHGQPYGNASQARRRTETRQKQQPRVKVRSDNVGGLSGPLLQELQAWLTRGAV